MMRRGALLSVCRARGDRSPPCCFAWYPAGPPPPVYAQVELIQQPTPTVGDGPRDSGEGQAEARTAPPPVAPTPPPTPPTQAELPPVPMPPVPPVPAAASPEPAPPPPTPARTKLPRQAVATAPPATAPPPPVPSPPRQAAASPPMPPAPPPSPPADAPPGPAEDPPAIRLGEGGPAGTGLVSGDNIIPAAPDSHVHNPPPAYPAEAARMGEQGTVILMVHVAPDGNAMWVDVPRDLGFRAAGPRRPRCRGPLAFPSGAASRRAGCLGHAGAGTVRAEGVTLMIRIDRVVTRGGDAGQTSLGDGTRVAKDALRVDAYGTVDEANAVVGVLRRACAGQHDAMLAAHPERPVRHRRRSLRARRGRRASAAERRTGGKAGAGDRGD